MKKVLVMGALVFALNFATAQSYTISPTNYLTGSVQLGQVANFEIDMENLLGTDLKLEWETLSNTLPSGWYVTLCDYMACYPYVPAFRAMDPIPVATHGFIKLTVDPDGILGGGIAVFKVWESGTSAFDTITFDLSSVVGIDKYDLNTTVHVYPNPASETVYLQNEIGNLDAGTLSILDITGAVVKKTEIAASAQAQIDIRDLSAGVYLVRFETEKGRMTSKLIKTK